MAPAPAAPAPAPRKRLFSMQKGRTRFSTPEHVWKKKDWAEQELAFKRRVGITIGPRAKTSYVPRASSRSPLGGGREVQRHGQARRRRSRWRRRRRAGKTDPRTSRRARFITGPSGRRRSVHKSNCYVRLPTPSSPTTRPVAGRRGRTTAVDAAHAYRCKLGERARGREAQIPG